MIVFKNINGTYRNKINNYEIEINLKDSLLMIQLTEYCRGIFVPCFDLGQFECEYGCGINSEIKCPYSKEIDEIIDSRVKYMQCRGKIEDMKEKIKKWVTDECQNEYYAELINDEWIFEKNNQITV